MGALQVSHCFSASSSSFDARNGWNHRSTELGWDHYPNENDVGSFFPLGDFIPCDAALEAIILEASASVRATTTASYRAPAVNALHAADCDDKNARLVHLLKASAEALSGLRKCPELARLTLARLRKLLVLPESKSIPERLVLHFTDALQDLLDGKGPTLYHSPIGIGDALSALQLMQDMSPYSKFGYFTANQAILDATAGERRIHIVDYDIMDGLQWASLIQALVSKNNVGLTLPPPYLRITAVVGVGRAGTGRWSTEKVNETGQRLMAFAASLGVSLSFGHCRLDRNQIFRPTALRSVKRVATIFNCFLHSPHLPYCTTASIKSFISCAAVTKACLVTLVEEERSGCAPGETVSFFQKMVDDMERYSAVMEALESGFPKQGMAREMVEREILVPSIAASVRRSYLEEEEEEEHEMKAEEKGIGEWMAVAGFRRVALSGFNVSQAQMLVCLFNSGYEVDEEAENKLVLSWKTRRLLSASAWSSPPTRPATSSTCQ